MDIKKAISSFAMTTLFLLFGTGTVFAANAGQATGNDVNVRAQAGTDAEILGKIDAGTEFEILDKEEDWYVISYQDEEGYVSDDFFDVTKTKANIEGSNVNLRENASTSANILGKFADGDTICVTGQNEEWYRIAYDNASAYVSKDFVSGTYVSDAVAFEGEGGVSSLYGVVTSGSGVKLRQGASLDAAVQMVLPYGTEVTVKSVGQEWMKVITDGGVEGYVSAEFLSVREGERTTRSLGTAKGSEVVAYGKQFIGTPYVWGGTNLRKGVDCSGFVYSVYKNFGITLNRSSYTMVNNGVEVSKANLQAGDLVFFNSGGNSKICHVGIYCGDGTYIHSTNGSAYGVTITPLNSDYSVRTYVTARRVLR